MRNLEDVKAVFTVDERGIIRSPGKFENEPAYVPVFWELVNDGCSDDEFDDCGVLISRMEIDSDDATAFPALADHIGSVIFLWEDTQGFVNHAIHSVDDADRLQSECEDASADDYSDG